MWGYCHADRAAYASSPRLWSCGTWPTETARGTDRWSSNPAHTSFEPGPHQSERVSTTAAQWRLGPVRNRRRSASLAPRWHRPMSIVLLAREGPCGRVLGSSNADRLRCRGGFRGKSVGRSSCRGIGPSKRSSSVDNHRDNGSHISGTRTKVGGQVLGKKLFGQHSSLIVEYRCAKPPTKVSARIGQKRFKSGNPRRRPNFLVMRGLARIRNSSPGQ